jgi:protein-disulfide isomerase
MKAVFTGGVALLALALAGCGDNADTNAAAGANSYAPLEQIAAPNGGDWTQIVSETPEGGFRMGNPDAPVKLVEYGSVSCGHCAEFAEKATDKLKNEYVKSGQVSWEFRPFLLFPTDPGMSALLRCQSPSAAFRLVDQIYAEQDSWMSQFRAIPEADLQRLQQLPPQQQAIEFAKAGKIDQFFRQRGVPQAKINACLADPASLQKLSEINSTAVTQHGISGTPTFLINGNVVPNTSAWEQLEPAIREALN